MTYVKFKATTFARHRNVDPSISSFSPASISLVAGLPFGRSHIPNIHILMRKRDYHFHQPWEYNHQEQRFYPKAVHDRFTPVQPTSPFINCARKQLWFNIVQNAHTVRSHASPSCASRKI
jgi:hypothetical protein